MSTVDVIIHFAFHWSSQSSESELQIQPPAMDIQHKPHRKTSPHYNTMSNVSDEVSDVFL